MITNKRIMLAAAAFLLAAVLPLGAVPFGPVLEEKKVGALTKDVYPSVVKVETGEGRKRVATGVVMDASGHIVTTALISSREATISVVTADGRRVKADFLGLDPETHIAVIQAKDRNLVPVALGSTTGLGPGAWIGVVSVSPENTPAVTQGIVSSVSEEKLRLNVWVVPGSSGSPVVNAEGRMVGLLRGVYQDDRPVVFEFREQEVVGSGYVLSRAEAPASGMAVAVPVEMVKSVFQEIKDKGKVSRGWLGVSITDTEDNKVMITGVEKDSPAFLAKLHEGDFVLKFDGKAVTDSASLASEVRKKRPGQDVGIQVERNGRNVDVRVKLGEYSKEDSLKEMEVKFPRLFELQKAYPSMPPWPPAETKPPTWIWESRKYIGVFLQETTEDLAGYFGLKEGKGLLINQLTKNGPAEKAGLRVGDVIFKADGKKVETVNALSAIVQAKKKGDKVKIEFLREKKALSVMVEVAEDERGDLIGMLSEGYLQALRSYSDADRLIMKNLQESYERQMREYEKSQKTWQESLKKSQKELGRLKYSYRTFQKI